MSSYTILEAVGPSALAIQVNSYLKLGYICQGGVAVLSATGPHADSSIIYFQAMALKTS